MQQNEIQGLWISFGILSGAAGGGFIFLLIAVLQIKEKMNACVTHKSLNEDFYRKEMIDTHLKNIDKELSMLANSVNQMILKMDKIIIKNIEDKNNTKN